MGGSSDGSAAALFTVREIYKILRDNGSAFIYVYTKKKPKTSENTLISGLFWHPWEDSNLWPTA